MERRPSNIINDEKRDEFPEFKEKYFYFLCGTKVFFTHWSFNYKSIYFVIFALCFHVLKEYLVSLLEWY